MAKKTAPTIKDLISLFCTNTGKKNYATYLNSIVKLANQHGTSLVSLVTTLTSNPIYRNPAKPGYIDPMAVAMTHFNSWTAGYGRSQNTIQNWKVAFKAFMEFHLGQYYGHIWLFNYVNPRLFCEIVAKSAIFASPDVVKDVVKGKLGTKDNIKGGCSKVNPCNAKPNSSYCTGRPGNPYASWDHCVHARDNKANRGKPTNDCNGLPCIADDNHYAKQAIKAAIKEKNSRLGLVSTGDFSDYVACHIWDNPDDCRYYTSIANLVLVPRAIYGLTDHCEEVKAVLRMRATYLFREIDGIDGIAIPPQTYPPISQNALSNATKIYPYLNWRQP